MEYTYSTDTLLLNNKRPSHWPLVRLRNLLRECNHQVGTRKDIPLLSLTKKGVILRDMDSGKGKFPKDFESYKIVEPNHLIFCLFDIDETPRTVGLSNLNGMITGAYDVFNISQIVDKQFIYYYFLAVDDQKALRPLYSGLRKVVQMPKFLGIQIPVPPPDEQKKIVNFLSNKTSLIESLLSEKQRIITLQQELLENLVFFGFDDGKATIHGWGNDFPSNWKLVKGRRIFEEIDRKGFTDERFVAVTQDKALIYKDEGDVNFVTAADPRTQKLVCPNQFVISLRSFQGGLELSSIRGLISPAYSVFKLKETIDNEKTRAFFRFLFKSRPYISLLNSLSDSLRDGKSIKFSEVADFDYPLPPSDFLDYFYKEVQKFDILQQEYVELEKLLTEYKQRLIADVVTGQIKVD